YAKTPQGKVIVAAFADSFNQMIKALRNYKAQTVKGGLGTGGRLGVSGGSTPASKEADQQAATPAATAAPAAAAPAASAPTRRAPAKKSSTTK
ncbi:MAG: hypothetical protein RJA44_2769, partial [Pseudomonadota bacterium]